MAVPPNSKAGTSGRVALWPVAGWAETGLAALWPVAGWAETGLAFLTAGLVVTCLMGEIKVERRPCGDVTTGASRGAKTTLLCWLII
jgi:hypothetical protein